MLREGIFLSVVNYCHMTTAPFFPENDREWREGKDGGGATKINSTLGV